MTELHISIAADFDKLPERVQRWLSETRAENPGGTFALDFRTGRLARGGREMVAPFFDRIHGGHGPQPFWGGVSRKAQYRWSIAGEALWAAQAPARAVSSPLPAAAPVQEDEPGTRTWTLAGLTYTSRDGGRWTCRGDDAQSLAPDARRARFGDGPEVDAENCHPSLILQLLGAERFPVLADYVANRGAWLARLQDEYGVDRAGAKRVVIALLYGADPDYDAGTVADLLGRSPGGELRALADELGCARSVLCEMHGSMNDAARRTVKRKYGFVPKWQYREKLERTLASLALQYHERRTLESAVQFHAERGECVVLLQHDGYRLAPGTAVTHDTLRAVSDHVARTTGIKLNYTVKESTMPTPMHDDIVLPETRNSAVTSRIASRTARAAAAAPVSTARVFHADDLKTAVLNPILKSAFPIPFHAATVRVELAAHLTEAVADARVDPEDWAAYAVCCIAYGAGPSAARSLVRENQEAFRAAFQECIDGVVSVSAPVVPAAQPVTAPVKEAAARTTAFDEETDEDAGPPLDGRGRAVFELLREAHPNFVSPDELQRAGGSKYQSRLGDLRALGYDIETWNGGDGVRSKYRLASLRRSQTDRVVLGVKLTVLERSGLGVANYGTAPKALDEATLREVLAAVRPILARAGVLS